VLLGMSRKVLDMAALVVGGVVSGAVGEGGGRGGREEREDEEGRTRKEREEEKRGEAEGKAGRRAYLLPSSFLGVAGVDDQNFTSQAGPFLSCRLVLFSSTTRARTTAEGAVP
jgi:hypothetical protein